MDKNFIMEWISFADRNLGIASHLEKYYRPTPLEDICFNCQQAAEKYLKGYLVYAANSLPPKTHDLRELCVLCVQQDKRFAQLMKACGILNPYSVQPRYPRETYIDEALMQKALYYAAEIKSFPPLAELREKLGLEVPHDPHP
ncbi:MAG: HEPN domain-containing protein [Firmicutes bacterium]|nr:HEPN domain-containing protein [Bacillota bacterium]